MPHERLWPPESFLSVQGHQFHYRVQGNGPALILVHGLAGYSFSWRRNLEELARRFRVYALDLVGAGYSDRPRDYPYSFSAVALQITEFARAAGEREIFLAGHSLGGAGALLCAARFPELVRGLVLLAPVNPFSRQRRFLIRLGGMPVLGHLILHTGRLFAQPLTGFVLRHRLYGDPKRVDRDTIAGYAHPLEVFASVEVLRRTFAAWDLDSLHAALPLIKQPALLIWGDRDRTVSPDSAPLLAAALRAQLEIIPGCGHLPAEEAPEVVNRLILQFLRNRQ